MQIYADVIGCDMQVAGSNQTLRSARPSRRRCSPARIPISRRRSAMTSVRPHAYAPDPARSV